MLKKEPTAFIAPVNSREMPRVSVPAAAVWPDSDFNTDRLKTPADVIEPATESVAIPAIVNAPEMATAAAFTVETVFVIKPAAAAEPVSVFDTVLRTMADGMAEPASDAKKAFSVANVAEGVTDPCFVVATAFAAVPLVITAPDFKFATAFLTMPAGNIEPASPSNVSRMLCTDPAAVTVPLRAIATNFPIVADGVTEPAKVLNNARTNVRAAVAVMPPAICFAASFASIADGVTDAASILNIERNAANVPDGVTLPVFVTDTDLADVPTVETPPFAIFDENLLTIPDGSTEPAKFTK